jgi:pyruvate/2-oxoglutarate dehydrogenase complex dihydrolipoamide acyltransferase (E2) component
VAVQIVLPQLGFSMTEGRLVSWLQPDGATIIEGAPLFELESDKALEEIAAPASGTLKIIAEMDATYTVGTVLGEIL